MVNAAKLKRLQAERDLRFATMEHNISKLGEQVLVQFIRDFNAYCAADAEVARHIMTGE